MGPASLPPPFTERKAELPAGDLQPSLADPSGLSKKQVYETINNSLGYDPWPKKFLSVCGLIIRW